MRKRLIGKAFAVAMSGAMVFTASPVTANIFNVASIVQAAEADQAESYHYCYVGLTWAEYWENEGVYNATDISSLNALDSHDEYDRGGYDVVTRATMNHGVSRASFQCMFTLNVTDASGNQKSIDIASFKSGSSLNDDFVLNGTDGKEYAVHKNKDADKITTSIDVSTGSDKYTFVNYEIKGTKYVPVKVSNDDWAAFSKQYEGKIIENGGTLTCGSTGEGNIGQKIYTASVDSTTQGLKTASKNSDGTFSFSKRVSNGTTSGIKDQELKTVSDVTPAVVANPKTGQFGEFLRVDITGNGYGDLGANMQSVEWTYYGSDATRTTALRTFGTKFAADNWMHSKQGVQLGLTNSIRCELPKDTDGTGYWSLTIHALGYNDYTYNFEVTSDNINQGETASEEHIADLKALVTEANTLTKSDYCESSDRDNTFDLLSTELGETVDLLKKDTLYDSEATGQKAHLEEAIAQVKALQKHEFTTVTTPATTSKDGSIDEKCKHCGDVKSTKVINKIASVALSKTSYKENSKVQKPSVTVKDSKGSVIAASNYTVSYSNAKSANPGTYKVTVKFKGNYSGTKTLSYKINAVAPAKTTVKLSSAKKTSLKATWKKVAKASSYEVQYATSKSFKGAKTVKVSSKSSSKVLTKLTKNKKYYVRVRAVRTVKVDNKNTTLRASWSSAKSLKTKKK